MELSKYENGRVHLLVQYVKLLNILSENGSFGSNHEAEQGKNTSMSRALDKSEYFVIIRDKFCSFCIKTYVVTTHELRRFR